MVELIEAIREYQSDGNREVFSLIHHAMMYDYLNSPRGLDFPHPEMYIAFRLLRLISGRLATIKYMLSDSGLSTKGDSPQAIFNDFARQLHSWTGIELTVDNYSEHEPYLVSYFGETFPELRIAFERIKGLRPTIWQRLTEKIVDECWPDLESALEFAISRVDASRSEREIVRYINLTTRTEYYRQQFGAMRRVRRDGRSKYVEPKFYDDKYTLFGGTPVDIAKLPRRQKQLVDKMLTIIRVDREKGGDKDYSVDITGGYRIKNRYMAKRLGMHEASLSRALRKIMKC
ncbi:hypothetical protein [Paenibacillus alvei]|nr:hypothetical protein [Paenibacillus alvei]